ncbi:unnamed protein product [Xylocopa violacea]|uniref:Uncharacterized protein n=1 Tax=Xylocopa violacea TaxID=135666 RepID=A0ABP1NXF5_XYLVO
MRVRFTYPISEEVLDGTLRRVGEFHEDQRLVFVKITVRRQTILDTCHQRRHFSVSQQFSCDWIRPRREQRPSFRRKELHNYTFERPPGRWGLRENRQPIPICTQIACDCRPYRPHAVAANDRLTLVVSIVRSFVYRYSHLTSDSVIM